ncbi:hypothetical protein ABKU21_05710 [Enterobacter hormaechei]
MTYTKEQLIEQAKTRMEANRYLLTRLPPESATVKEVAMNLAIDEIALAALTAEPEVQPVQVPEWTNEQCLEFLSIAFRHAEIKGDLEMDDIRLGVKMVNDSRAAMLQGEGEPAAILKPAIFIDGNISPDDADKLADAFSKLISERREPQRMIAEPVSQRDELTDAVNGLLAVMDEYPETLVPINRDSAVVRQLRVAAGD